MFYAETAAASHTNTINSRVNGFAKYVYSIRGTIDSITPVDLINYRRTLDKKHEWYLATARGFLYAWDEFCNGQVKPDTFLSHFPIVFPLKNQRRLIA
jgi:hypothetical protein